MADEYTEYGVQIGAFPDYAGCPVLPVLQLFAYYRAVHFGKNPDLPRNLTSVAKPDF